MAISYFYFPAQGNSYYSPDLPRLLINLRLNLSLVRCARARKL